ncbi:MAG: PEGA domain-containing protein [Opitutales bacterium]|nr:PEGA domain-containing protein [Opitutales bacterium]
MEHKGLNYTFAILAVVSIMIALVAYSLDNGGARTFTIDTFPANANVYLNGKQIGRAPVKLDGSFMRRHKITGFEDAPILRVFTPLANGSIVVDSNSPQGKAAAKNKEPEQKAAPQILTFALPTKEAEMPQIFDKAKPDAQLETPQKSMGAFIYFEKADKMIVVFDSNKMPRLPAEERMRANVIWFGGDVSLNVMGQYKSFKKN